MTTGKHSVDRHVAVKVRQDLGGTGGVPPVPHEVANDGEERDELDAGTFHAGVCRIADELSGGTGTLDVGEDGVTLGAEREGEEGGADISDNTGDDDLLLSGGLDGGAELLVVPGASCWLVFFSTGTD